LDFVCLGSHLLLVWVDDLLQSHLFIRQHGLFENISPLGEVLIIFKCYLDPLLAVISCDFDDLLAVGASAPLYLALPDVSIPAYLRVL